MWRSGSHLDRGRQQREARGLDAHHRHVQRARESVRALCGALDALDELGVGVRDHDDVALRVGRLPAGRGHARGGGGWGGGGERDVEVGVAAEAREHELDVGCTRLHTRGYSRSMTRPRNLVLATRVSARPNHAAAICEWPP